MHFEAAKLVIYLERTNCRIVFFRTFAACYDVRFNQKLNQAKMKNSIIIVLSFFCFLTFPGLKAQDSLLLVPNDIPQAIYQEEEPDTLLTLGEEDLKHLPDLRTALQQLNKPYTKPKKITASLQKFLEGDKLEMSEEALYWINKMYDRSNEFDAFTTFRDTIIVNPLFMPIMFRGDYLPKDLTFFHPDSLMPGFKPQPLYRPDTTFLASVRRNRNRERSAHDYVEQNYPERFRYSVYDLPNDTIRTRIIRKHIAGENLLPVINEADFSDEAAPAKFIPERRYWTSSFENTIQFSQNYISPNWNGGGNSNFNIIDRQFFKYDYNKDKIQVTNELELKLNVNTLPDKADSVHSYKVNDNLIRFRTLFGYKAFEKWFYTLDVSFSTQIVKNYDVNSDRLLAAFLAPMTFNSGLGMKYQLTKEIPKVMHRNVTFDVNIAPLSFNYMYSRYDDANMDLARHGFKQKENYESLPEGENQYEHVLRQLGSKIEANLTFNINRNVTWTSRFYYFTDYHRITGEWENTLNLQISRFFSTRIYLHLRYDDGVDKLDDFDRYIQVNELLSFGFNYKW